MLRPLGIKPPRISPKVYLSEAEENFADQIFENFEIRKSEFGSIEEDLLLAIHPGSGNSFLNLPIKRFAKPQTALSKI